MDLLSLLKHGPGVSLNFKREVEEGLVIIPPRIAGYVETMNFRILSGQRMTDISELAPCIADNPGFKTDEGLCIYDPYANTGLIALAEYPDNYRVMRVKKNTVHEICHGLDFGNILIRQNKIIRGSFSDEPDFVTAHERDCAMAEITSRGARLFPEAGIDIGTLDYQREGKGVGRREVWANHAVHFITGKPYTGTLPISFARSGLVVAQQFRRMDWMEETIVGRALKAVRENEKLKAPRLRFE